MGCSTSSGVTIENPSPKNPHHGKEASKQAEKEASLETISISPSGSISEDDSYQGKLQKNSPEQFTTTEEGKTGENTDNGIGLPKKLVSLVENERQPSSDILKELRTQGIIKSSSTTLKNRTADDTMTSEEQQKKELLIGRPSPIISQESSTTEYEIDCSTSIVKKASDTFQLLSLNVRPRNLKMEKEEMDDNVNHRLEDFNMIESDITYNTINEIF